MSKIIEPAIDSIWEHKNGTRFQVLTFIPGLAGGCQLRAITSGRRHWVTPHGLQAKYQWVSDPVDEDEAEQEIEEQEQ